MLPVSFLRLEAGLLGMVGLDGEREVVVSGTRTSSCKPEPGCGGRRGLNACQDPFIWGLGAEDSGRCGWPTELGPT